MISISIYHLEKKWEYARAYSNKAGKINRMIAFTNQKIHKKIDSQNIRKNITSGRYERH